MIAILSALGSIAGFAKVLLSGLFELFKFKTVKNIGRREVLQDMQQQQDTRRVEEIRVRQDVATAQRDIVQRADDERRRTDDDPNAMFTQEEGKS